MISGLFDGRSLAVAASISLALGAITGAAGAQEAQSGTGAILRGLDKMTDEAVDMTLKTGQSARFGHIKVTLRDCRYPSGDISADAYASLLIEDDNMDKPAFSGWMVASSPAVNAMEHRRYDVWVLRCTTS